MNRWTIAVVILVLVPRTLSAAPVAPCAAIPSNIKVEPFFGDLVDGVVAGSPTFAAQCGRIAGDPSVRVVVQLLPKLEESCCRARTVIQRHDSGALFATIEIPSPRTRKEYAELLGHEFEHILEQMEQLDLASGAPGIKRLAAGTFETARARRAGEVVALEIEAADATSPPSPPPAR